MSNISGVSGGLSSIRNPTAIRYTIQVINTEESIVLPANTKTYVLRNVGKRFIRLAFATGQIALGEYLTLAPFEPAPCPGIINQTSLTLFVYSPGLETLEIEIWR